ncbi:hypothetical protein [Komagataeibacter europaeus]|uniref:hypothetical protein n=1 Tax=Komagataeibacter europaeus TaxID=33995 RepID=UPI0015FBC170|nr:hypothetical protein [Komagataeibacter europaeus]
MAERKLLRLHLLARSDDQDRKLMSVGLGECESGHWVKLLDAAPAAIGAEIHLHERQGDRSWKAGRITGWRPSEVLPGRIVFRFKVDPMLQRTQRSGWGNEQARVWEDSKQA